MTVARGVRRTASKPRVWIIRDDGDGSFSVLRAGRQLQTDLSQERATKVVTRQVGPGERVLFEELDGYRQDITRRI